MDFKLILYIVKVERKWKHLIRNYKIQNNFTKIFGILQKPNC